MFNFLCKTVLHGRYTITTSPTHKLYLFQNNPLLSLSLRCISSTVNQHSFTVSYLINSCGLSPESALSASKSVHFETPDKPDSVINLFKNKGFSQTQITKLIKIRPRVLLSDTEKTLLPKLEFFHSKGASAPDLAKLFVTNPQILERSLRNHIIPSFDYLRNFLQSDDKTIKTIKGCCHLFGHNLEPIINILQDNGVPESNIAILLKSHPWAFLSNPDKLRTKVEEVRKMGFDPLKWQFVWALRVMTSISKSNWERKCDVYKRWGWSEDQILAAFRKQPLCMVKSEGKIESIMDFFVNKLDWEPSIIAHRPFLVFLSLDKRIIPRALVLQFLMSKGLVKKNFRSTKLFEYSEKDFLQRYVNCYEEAPQLLKLYTEKLQSSNG